jgi:hypothetical protein
MKLTFVICILCIAAHAQINGTIIVFELTNDGMFIAADSRATFQDRPAEDNHCKIAAINQGTIFAVGGAAAYPADSVDPVHSWDAIHEARLASDATNGRVFANAQDVAVSIADIWARSMERNWNMVNIWYPEKVREANKRGKGVLTSGLFATGKKGAVSLAARYIKFNGSVYSEVVPIADICTNGKPCGLGELDIFFEFLLRTSDRAKKEKALPTSPILQVMRLVHLTIAYDRSGTVGGPIDALQLRPDGRVTWSRQKKDCPENHR